MYKFRIGHLFLVLVFLAFFACKSEADKASDEVRKLSNAGRENEAFELANKSIEKYPNHADLYYQRGFSYYRAGNYERALQDFTNCIKIDDKNADGYYGIALIYRDRKEYDLAQSNFDKAINLAKNKERKSVYLSGIAGMKSALQDYESAISYIRQAISISNDSSYYYTLGRYLYNNNQRKEAEEAWLTGLRKDNFRQIRFKEYVIHELSNYYLEEEEYEKALSYIDKALEISPGEKTLLDIRNLIRSKM